MKHYQSWRRGGASHSRVLFREVASTVQVHLLWITGFAIATSIAARFEIPHEPVPFTLQTMVVLLAGAYLGAFDGAMSQFIYLAMGALGAPVFAGGSSGIAYLFGPTGGYLLSFPVAAWVVGMFLHRKQGPQVSFLTSLFVMLGADLLIFAFGTSQLYATYFHNWWRAFEAGFLIFSWWDLLKVAGAAFIYTAPRLRKRENNKDADGKSNRQE
ncbi:MAG: biotin transporter BioY [Bacteroidota bacterium]